MGSPKTEDPGEDFLRRYKWCEEDRCLFTTQPWTGGFRWFRSPNVIPIEHYRRTRRHVVGGKDDTGTPDDAA
jgi:hypothetical protein